MWIPGPDDILEQRDVVDVDGEELALRQGDERQRGAGAGGEDRRGGQMAVMSRGPFG